MDTMVIPGSFSGGIAPLSCASIAAEYASSQAPGTIDAAGCSVGSGDGLGASVVADGVADVVADGIGVGVAAPPGLGSG
ncbi:hypothetical protein GCM10010460_27570 [Microbacterium terrae]|nr:hypothetical protein GCM10017594_31460 [Microbacterium terrae]